MPAAAQAWGLADLRALTGLTAEQWQAVLRGEPQARILDKQEKREVAIVGVAYVQATTGCFISSLQDIENFKKNEAVLRIGKLAGPAGLRDRKEFALADDEVAALRNCRVGNCSVKLPARTIERLQRDVDWSRRDYAATVQSIFREEMSAYVQTYLNRGNSALVEYRDRSDPVRLAADFRGVLDARPGLADLVPQFYGYLAGDRSEAPPGVSEFLYWSMETFGLKPVTSITEVSIFAQPGRVVTASKQIYASHYFDASLGLSAALDDPGRTSGPGMYLVYLNRSRIDFLGGFFGGLQRALGRRRLRDGMRKNLVEVVRKLETSCAAANR